MQEIRWHGRGGDGGFTSARLMGYAAVIHCGKYAQAFPSFGPERRGAPVLGFVRIDDKPITDHSQVYTCDCVVVLDETLLDVVNVVDGLKKGAPMLINSTRPAKDFKALPAFREVEKIYTIDATTISLKELGSSIVNTAMLGAAVAATNLIPIEAVEASIDEYMSPALREKNKRITRTAYEMILKGEKEG